MWNLKNYTNELIYKIEIDTDIESNVWSPKGKGGRVINQEFEINRYTLLYIKWINKKDLLYSTGNYTQYHVIIYKGKGSEEQMYI